MKQQPFHRRGADVETPGPASPLWTGAAIVLALFFIVGSGVYLVVEWIDRHTHHCPTTVRR